MRLKGHARINSQGCNQLSTVFQNHAGRRLNEESKVVPIGQMTRDPSRYNGPGLRLLARIAEHRTCDCKPVFTARIFRTQFDLRSYAEVIPCQSKLDTLSHGKFSKFTIQPGAVGCWTTVGEGRPGTDSARIQFEHGYCFFQSECRRSKQECCNSDGLHMGSKPQAAPYHSLCNLREIRQPLWGFSAGETSMRLARERHVGPVLGAGVTASSSRGRYSSRSPVKASPRECIERHDETTQADTFEEKSRPALKGIEGNSICIAPWRIRVLCTSFFEEGCSTGRKGKVKAEYDERRNSKEDEPSRRCNSRDPKKFAQHASRIALIHFALSLSILLTGCASIRGGWRLAIGTSGGAAIGAGAGALLSPNDPSRALNALVFGLIGGLGGGALAFFTDPTPPPPKGGSLKEKEAQDLVETTQYQVGSAADLPAYVRQRLAPVVIEEAVERDAVGEDGSLHEPHKVYRIVRPAELTPMPTKTELGKSR